MELQSLLEEFFRKNLRITDDSTRRKYGYSLANLRATLGREPRLRDLNDDAITEMMGRLRTEGLAARTINDRRSRLCALWNWAARRGLVTEWPSVPPLREPRRIPVAFTVEEMQRLFDACIAQRGSIGPIPASLWWSALVSLLWDSGERITALVAIEWTWLRDEWLVIPAEARKLKADDMAYRLSEQSVQLVNMIRQPPRTLILPWPMHPLYLWTRFGRILEQAGLPNDRRHKFHAIRRSVASHMHAAGGNASEAMGHTSESVTKQHYLDPRVTGRQHPVDYLPRLTRDNPRPPTDDRRRA